jgi:hypothetical protein
MGSLIHTPKTVVTRGCLRKGSKYICLQNLESQLYLTKYLLKIIFGNISHLLQYVLTMHFKPFEAVAIFYYMK